MHDGICVLDVGEVGDLLGEEWGPEGSEGGLAVLRKGLGYALRKPGIGDGDLEAGETGEEEGVVGVLGFVSQG